MTSNQKPRLYRMIVTGSGGTYENHSEREPAFDSPDIDPETLPAIGTYGCNTCVGVYMRLSANRCFAAHIAQDFSGKTSDQDQDQDLINLRKATPTEGAYIRERTKSLLEAESLAQTWPPVREITTIVLICPRLRDDREPNRPPLSGTYVVEGISDFLQRAVTELPVREDAHGFVVTHASGGVEYLSFADAKARREGEFEGPEDDVRFFPHCPPEGNGAWFVDIDKA